MSCVRNRCLGLWGFLVCFVWRELRFPRWDIFLVERQRSTKSFPQKRGVLTREPVFDWRRRLRRNRWQDRCFLRGSLSCLKAIACTMGCCRPPLFNFCGGELNLVCLFSCAKGLSFPQKPHPPRGGEVRHSPWRSACVELRYAAEKLQLPRCDSIPRLLWAFHLPGSAQLRSAFLF